VACGTRVAIPYERPPKNWREEVWKMKRSIRIAVGSAALVAGLAVAGASTANAQVRFRGSFPLPHGRISVNVGGPVYGGYPVYGGGYYDQFAIGGYVPYGYDVYEDPTYGWGFVYDNQWYPCEPRGSRFVIIASPFYYGGYRNYGYRDYRYSRPYSNRYYSRDYGYRRWDNRRDRNWGRNDRRWDHNDRNRDGRRDRNWGSRDGNYRRHN
jgi:hypothetical protein